MEDLDRDRVLAGSADEILRTLEAFGFRWDGPVEYQSRRTEHYAAALSALMTAGATFECSCSRRELASEEPSPSRYPGTCRSGPRRPGPAAVRFRIERSAPISLEDRFQGPIDFPPHSVGDVIVRRRDGVFAYQLAVVVDDALQGVSEVVRGADLLESTAWQMALQQALVLPTPRYGHLPLLTEPGGAKLAKSRRSLALEPARAGEQLLTVLALLRQSPPAALAGAAPSEVLAWAIDNWNPRAFHGIRALALPEG